MENTAAACGESALRGSLAAARRPGSGAAWRRTVAGFVDWIQQHSLAASAEWHLHSGRQSSGKLAAATLAAVGSAGQLRAQHLLLRAAAAQRSGAQNCWEGALGHARWGLGGVQYAGPARSSTAGGS